MYTFDLRHVRRSIRAGAAATTTAGARTGRLSPGRLAFPLANLEVDGLEGFAKGSLDIV